MKVGSSQLRGFATLLAVLIVGAVGTAIALSLLALGTNSARSMLVAQQSLQARALAKACGEEALEQIHISSTYSGFGNLQIPGGNCGYLVVDGGGQNRIITVSSSVALAIRKIVITLDMATPTLHVAAWQEVPD